MQIKPLTRRRQRGMTLIELIAALAVAGLVIAGALALYNNANNAQRANALLGDITSIKGSANQLYAGQYAGINGGDLFWALLQSGRLPGTWVAQNPGAAAAGGPYNNSFGVTFLTPNAAAVNGIPVGNTMQLGLNNIPSAVCTTLAANAQGWLQVSIAPGAIQAGQAAGVLIPYPLTPAARANIANACAQANSVSMLFTGT